MDDVLRLASGAKTEVPEGEEDGVWVEGTSLRPHKPRRSVTLQDKT